jgi:hypothetical protein
MTYLPLDVACGTCAAQPGEYCVGQEFDDYKRVALEYFHAARILSAQRHTIADLPAGATRPITDDEVISTEIVD